MTKERDQKYFLMEKMKYLIKENMDYFINYQCISYKQSQEMKEVMNNHLLTRISDDIEPVIQELVEYLLKEEQTS